MEQSTHQFHKIFCHISKCLACNAEKTLQLKITKKRMNITNYNKFIYMQIYIPKLYVTKMIQDFQDFLLQDFHI